MVGKRFAGVTLAGAFVALSLVATTPAGGPANQGTPITATLSGANCSQLAPDVVVTLTGTERTSTDASGKLHTIISGTATDNLGGRYVFNYSNNLRQPTTFPGDFMVSDHFNLVGSGPANKVHTFFVLRIHFTSPTDFSVLILKTQNKPLSFETGEEICDPL